MKKTIFKYIAIKSFVICTIISCLNFNSQLLAQTSNLGTPQTAFQHRLCGELLIGLSIGGIQKSKKEDTIQSQKTLSQAKHFALLSSLFLKEKITNELSNEQKNEAKIQSRRIEKESQESWLNITKSCLSTGETLIKNNQFSISDIEQAKVVVNQLFSDYMNQ